MKLNHIISIILLSVTLFTGCEKTESVAEETTVSETTAATIPADLTEEEMAIWESMPDIVTMRVYDDLVENTTEVVYIEKNGTVKKYIPTNKDLFYDDYDGKNDFEWVNEKITEHINSEMISTVDIHKLIEFYSMLLLVDKESPMMCRQNLSMNEKVKITENYAIYGIQSNEIILLSDGYLLTENVHNDKYGDDIYKLYIELEPFREINVTGITY